MIAWQQRAAAPVPTRGLGLSEFSDESSVGYAGGLEGDQGVVPGALGLGQGEREGLMLAGQLLVFGGQCVEAGE